MAEELADELRGRTSEMEDLQRQLTAEETLRAARQQQQASRHS